ncbi:MerR family transcriptional regulator [Amycolatopsis magusensis]|uniref:DNA polymerase III subunit beta family protein n=1 Tax=Amycolatopsis magusensis TaxID=882444 RepID=UPI0024A80536|nr:MerR family transcriptional regulator [Amycolatopsis magusensis]MDI5977867.1 MerR family transcriptional regulator [Amycolatopsis magusensis]
MDSPNLMSIGAFAQRTALTPSALRFYGDAGLLPPESVDPVSGYRYYSEAQIDRAVRLRQLRELGMPLPRVNEVLDADPVEAARLIDERITDIGNESRYAQGIAAELKAALSTGAGTRLGVLSGPALADAIDRVLAATVQEAAVPVLNAVYLEVSPGSATLTATDRYRLTTRTLALPEESASEPWAATLSGDDLRATVAQIRRSARIVLHALPGALEIELGNGVSHRVAILALEFPDYRLMLDSLAAVTHRVTAARQQLVSTLDQLTTDSVELRLSEANSVELRTPDAPARDLPARVDGGDLTIRFQLTTLYPAILQAVGPDVMLDLRGPDQPVTVRSADNGALSTLVMPIAAPGNRP